MNFDTTMGLTVCYHGGNAKDTGRCQLYYGVTEKKTASGPGKSSCRAVLLGRPCGETDSHHSVAKERENSFFSKTIIYVIISK